jgi:hypothetical protein
MDTMSDIAAKQREERAKIRADADLFVELLRHPGWPRYVELVQTVAQNYHATIMKPLESILECGKIEFAKGVLSGLSLASTLPTMKINEARELRREADDE